MTRWSSMAGVRCPLKLSRHLDGDGLWKEADSDLRWARGQPALFLDRDGVLVEDVNHLRRVQDVSVISGAGALIADANRRGIPVVVVTNQAGITHGQFGWAEF